MNLMSRLPTVNHTTIIFTTIDRPDMVKRLVGSIRQFYPDIKIIVGDQNALSEEMREFYSDNAVERIQLAYDCGVGVGRTECAMRASTEYILLCDDDFIFTPETDLDIPNRILEQIRLTPGHILRL